MLISVSKSAHIQISHMDYLMDCDFLCDASFDFFKNCITQSIWSPYVYKEEMSKKLELIYACNSENFKSSDFVVLDIDRELTLEMAFERLAEKKISAIIGLTRSHQKVKNGSIPACDRFRIIIPLLKRVVDRANLGILYSYFHSIFPEADKACKDAARRYYPCTDIVYEDLSFGYFRNDTEELTQLEFEPESIIKKETPFKEIESSNQARGRLSGNTKNFIKHGANEGQWHDNFFKAAVDLKEQLYTYFEAAEILKEASPRKLLDKEDLRQLRYIYEKMETRYPPRFPSGTALQDNRSSVPSNTELPPLKTGEQCQKDYEDNKKLRVEAFKNATPFICDAFKGVLSLVNGLILILAQSGDGKSSVLVNIVFNFLRHSKKKIVYISNEESSEDILSRLACLSIGEDWSMYRNGELKTEIELKLDVLSRKLANRVLVYGTGTDEENGLNTNTVGGVLKILAIANNHKDSVGLVVLDYYQNVIFSDSNKNDMYGALKEFGVSLKNFARSCVIPVVIAAQLKPQNKNYEAHISERIQYDKTIFNHVQVAVEVIPDKSKQETTFSIVKDRWGKGPLLKVTCSFEKGRIQRKGGFISTAENYCVPESIIYESEYFDFEEEQLKIPLDKEDEKG